MLFRLYLNCFHAVLYFEFIFIVFTLQYIMVCYVCCIMTYLYCMKMYQALFCYVVLHDAKLCFSVLVHYRVL